VISFRFHIVSIIAVFLGMAIGVVVGSTYVEQATVALLRNRIDAVEDNLDNRRAKIDQLEEELERQSGYISASDDFAVTDRLTGVPALVLAVRGVDSDAVKETTRLADQAGGEVPGVVWLEPSWALESDDDRQALAEVLGRSTTDGDILRDAAWDSVVSELNGDPTQEGSVLDALVERGFLSVEPLDDGDPVLSDLAGRSPRLLVVTGTDAEPSLQPTFVAAVQAAVNAAVPTVAAEVHAEREDSPPRGALVTETLDEQTRGSIIVVDHADTVAGRVAAVLSLDAVADAVVGHFGYGADATDVLPAWSQP
jgi:hypothetical protein